MKHDKEILRKVLAKYRGRPDFIFKRLIKGDQKGVGQDTPLHLAAREGASDDIRIFVACGADANVIGDMGYTPLLWAVQCGHVDAVTMLLALGANRGIKNDFGFTPLDIALQRNYAEIIKLLDC